MDHSYETVSNQGERVLSSDREVLFKAHADRYEFSLEYLAPGQKVLDCACGSGYGSEILSRRVGRVVGVDLSPVAIDYCRSHYALPTIEFREGSAEALDFAAESFDAVVSFETLEHVPHPERLLSEARRVLKPGGTFLVSTPNRVNSGLASGERPKNPFHLYEWSLREFDQLLRPHFSSIQYFGQRVRSRNKFHPRYVLSKWRRFRNHPDLVMIPHASSLMERMESPSHWQPEIFIAVCRVA